MRASLFILCFVFAIVSDHASGSNEVLDTNGKPVKVGARYTILPVLRGFGGAITRGAGKNASSCTSGVVQSRLELFGSTRVVFVPANGDKDVVRISTDVNIKFWSPYSRDLGKCSASSVWTREFDEVTRKYFITTGGEEGQVGPEFFFSGFKIETLGDDDYYLVFCPGVCITCKFPCREVGVYVDNGVRRLTTIEVPKAQQPLRVKFKKA